MKKIILVLTVLSSFTFAAEWVCYRYVAGKPTGGFIKVTAETKQEANKKALEKYKKLGYKIDSVNCK
jgi:hypothetical protein